MANSVCPNAMTFHMEPGSRIRMNNFKFGEKGFVFVCGTMGSGNSKYGKTNQPHDGKLGNYHATFWPGAQGGFCGPSTASGAYNIDVVCKK
jgi:hypothetical protein